MATASTITAPSTLPGGTHADVLVCVSSMPQEALRTLLANLTDAFPDRELLVASPDATMDHSTIESNIRLVGYEQTAQTAASRLDWTTTAAVYLNTHEMVRTYPVRAVLSLGLDAQTLSPQGLLALAGAVLDGNADLAMPHYDLPARSGLVNSSLLYPVSRALFGARPRFPLAPDLALTPRMAERLATAAQRFTALNQPDALLWPVAEAAVAGFSVTDVAAGERSLPQPAAPDLNSLLAQVTSSLFADLDQKAAFWQRSRIAPPSHPATAAASLPGASAAEVDLQIAPMIDSFRLAYGNLREIWQLVLPPQSLFSLKRLSEMPAATFRMPDSVWARTVYDFLLAFRLRTINRGHLMGALTPLYLAWVASHLLLTASGTDAEAHVEAQAAAFEADKAYLVSRWRWPDRFNP